MSETIYLVAGFSAGLVAGIMIGWFLAHQIAKAYSKGGDQ